MAAPLFHMGRNQDGNAFQKTDKELQERIKRAGWVTYTSSNPEQEEDMIESAQLGLEKIRIDRDKLIEKLRVNLEKHTIEFGEALEKWHVEAIALLKSRLKTAEGGEDPEFPVYLEKPIDHSKDYKRMISMLSASEDKIVIVTAQEFRQYHDDEWNWMGHHNASLETYGISKL